MDAELSREVDHRLRAEHAGMHVAPGRFRGHVFLEAAVGLIDPAVEHQFRGPGLKPLRREFSQQRYRVVVELAPADRIEFAEEIGHFRMPAPPQVAGQSHTLVVEILRRQLEQSRRGRGCWMGGGTYARGRIFGLTHGAAPGGRWRREVKNGGNQPEGLKSYLPAPATSTPAARIVPPRASPCPPPPRIRHTQRHVFTRCPACRACLPPSPVP